MPDAVSEPTAKDFENCRFLLAFIEGSFHSATVGGLAIDELAASLRTVLYHTQNNFKKD